MSFSNSSVVGEVSGSFSSVALSTDGINGIAGSLVNTVNITEGIYYTSDSGATWIKSTFADGIFSSRSFPFLTLYQCIHDVLSLFSHCTNVYMTFFPFSHPVPMYT